MQSSRGSHGERRFSSNSLQGSGKPPASRLIPHLSEASCKNGKPAEDDLSNWSHNPDISTVKDEIMRKAGQGVVSFVFTCDVAGKELEPLEEKENQKGPNRRHTTSCLSQKPQIPSMRPLSLCIRSSTSSDPIGYRSITAGLGKRKPTIPEVDIVARLRPIIKYGLLTRDHCRIPG